MMKKLQDLQKSDPEKFKKVAAQIATKLRAAAKNQSGGSASALNKMADDFDQAAKTGEMPKPPSGKQGPHPSGSPPSGSSATSESAASKYAATKSNDFDSLRSTVDSIFADALNDVSSAS
jgi:hypothetical protein